MEHKCGDFGVRMYVSEWWEYCGVDDILDKWIHRYTETNDKPM